MTLRPYQARACNEVRAAWARGDRRVCLVAPTGAGKTVMASELLRGSERPLAIVHTRVLRGQTERRIPGVDVVTIQSLLPESARADDRRELARRADVIYADECHHWAGEDWRRVVPLFRPDVRIVGCTATPERADGTPLGDIFGALVVAASYSELIRDGYLCPIDIDKPEMSRSKMRRLKVRPDPAQGYLSRAKREDGSWRPGILFAPTISTCQDAVTALRRAGVRAALVCCDTDEVERQRLFDLYGEGELDVLASPMALAEGFDATRAEVCVLGRSAAHVGTYLQMAGRVLRPHPGKDRALLVDCSDAASVHGSPTDDRVYSLDGRAIERAEEREKREPLEQVELSQEELILMGYQRQRAALRDAVGELDATRRERNYKDGWLYHRALEQLGIKLPHRLQSKYRSVCTVCRHRVEVGSDVYWSGPGQASHPDCWYESLPAEVLDQVRRPE